MTLRASETIERRSESKNFFEKLTNGDFQIMEKLSDFWEKLKTSELAGMVGAASFMLKEWLGLDEDKEKSEKNPLQESQMAQKEVRAQVDTRRNLVALKEGIRPQQKPSEKLDQPDGRGMVFIGDSMIHGMQLKYPKDKTQDKRPKFIGKDGNPSDVTLAQLRKEREALKGAKEVRIYTGGNNVDDPPEKIVSHMIEMAEIARQEGVRDIIIHTRFPIDGRRRHEMGEERFKVRQQRNLALREAVIQAHSAGRFPPGTKLIDLFKQFRIGGEGPNKDELQPKYQGADLIHPRAAYVDALNFAHRESNRLEVS